MFHVPISALDEQTKQIDTQGWDSLAFLELLVSIEKAFAFKMSPRDIMNIECLIDVIQIVKQNVSAS